MEDFKSLLDIIPKVSNYKDVVKVDMEWDCGDLDFVECHKEFEADEFFRNKKLIWSLAYLNYFGIDIKYRDYINYEALYDVVGSDNHLWGNMYDYPAHTLSDLDITYYDEDGNQFDIGFIEFNKVWDNLSEEEICKEVNDVLLNND